MRKHPLGTFRGKSLKNVAERKRAISASSPSPSSRHRRTSKTPRALKGRPLLARAFVATSRPREPRQPRSARTVYRVQYLPSPVPSSLRPWAPVRALGLQAVSPNDSARASAALACDFARLPFKQIFTDAASNSSIACREFRTPLYHDRYY